jgi:hypothetical protein
MVLPLTRCLASLCFIVSAAGVLIAAFQMVRRRLRGEVLATGIASLALSALLLLIAYS